MKRIQKGMLFGQNGLYISRPGDDLDNPTQALLLDSRYDSLELHAYGRRQMNREVLSSQNRTRYTSLGEVTFASLGYRPMIFVAPVRRANSLVSYYTAVNLSDGTVTGYDVSVGGSNNNIRFEFEVANNNGPEYDFLWVVYRNPA